MTIKVQSVVRHSPEYFKLFPVSEHDRDRVGIVTRFLNDHLAIVKWEGIIKAHAEPIKFLEEV